MGLYPVILEATKAGLFFQSILLQEGVEQRLQSEEVPHLFGTISLYSVRQDLVY